MGKWGGGVTGDRRDVVECWQYNAHEVTQKIQWRSWCYRTWRQCLEQVSCRQSTQRWTCLTQGWSTTILSKWHLPGRQLKAKPWVVCRRCCHLQSEVFAWKPHTHDEYKSTSTDANITIFVYLWGSLTVWFGTFTGIPGEEENSLSFAAAGLMEAKSTEDRGERAGLAVRGPGTWSSCIELSWTLHFPVSWAKSLRLSPMI